MKVDTTLYEPQLKALEEAMKKGDTRMVEREAHTIKGAAANLGTQRIGDLSFELELLGRKGDLKGTEKLIADLRTEFKNLKEYIEISLPREKVMKS